MECFLTELPGPEQALGSVVPGKMPDVDGTSVNLTSSVDSILVLLPATRPIDSLVSTPRLVGQTDPHTPSLLTVRKKQRARTSVSVAFEAVTI